MSFSRYLESKARPAVTVSYDHYREEVERAVYDTLLDPVERGECILTHMAEVMDLRSNLERLEYPRREELLMAVASREPAKIRRAHEQFSTWGKRREAEEVPLVENALFECRSYLYGKEVQFTKETANKLVEESQRETERNIKKIQTLLERAIQRIPNWHGSSVILKVLKTDKGWVSNEGMVIVGQPPSMTFVCNNEKPTGLEIYDIQDIEGYPLSVQEDYANLIRFLQTTKPTPEFQTWYFVARRRDRPKLEQVKRELALGIEATLPGTVELLDSPPDTMEMDVWRVKMKGKTLTEVSEAPVRWLDLYRKAES